MAINAQTFLLSLLLSLRALFLSRPVMSQPNRPDTIGIALCLSGIMPMSNVDQDWLKWTHDHLRDAVALCIKVDPNAAYHHVPEDLLRATIAEGQGEGKAFLLDVLEKAKKGVPDAVLALRDQVEPEDSDDEDDYGVEYEDWYGYDGSLTGFEAACNYEVSSELAQLYNNS